MIGGKVTLDDESDDEGVDDVGVVEEDEINVEVGKLVLPKPPLLRCVGVKVDDVVIVESGVGNRISCAILSPCFIV